MRLRSYCTASFSAQLTVWMMPPSVWLMMPSGLITRPASIAAHTRFTATSLPISTSTISAT